MSFVDVDDVTLDKRIRDFDRTLLQYITRRMDEKNELRLKQYEMAAELKTRPARISESIGRLREAGYIITEGVAFIRVNPDYYWRTFLVENEKIVGAKTKL